MRSRTEQSRARGALAAGVDEAGRGPLAGPVMAAAVILDPADPIEGLADSKVLSEGEREALAGEIRRRALCWALGRADHREIDRVNILRASLLAMARAVAALPLPPDFVLVDGNQAPPVECRAQTVVRGDATIAAISAASILAKTARDAEMLRADLRYPGYGFARHKGYPTRAHLVAIEQLGVCPIHRRSFAPVAARIVVNKQ
jgi:ribonuclease HII